MAGDKKSTAQVKVGRWVARTVHAAIEGIAFLWTVPGFRYFLAANSVALCYFLGPKKSTAVALNSALLCAGGKFVHVLVTSAKEKYPDDQEQLGSIWDYEPPGELAGSGAWVVLRELATTMNSANEVFPELKNLEVLPMHDMALRLCFLFDHYDRNPVCETVRAKESVDEAKLQLLGEMLWFADQAYEGESERTLHARLTKKGFGLAHVKLTSTWAEHCPAYYVAVNLDAKQLLISVRGTAQIEDVVTDLTALPKEFGDSGHLVHSGMLASAEWLSERLSCIAQGLHEAGYNIITVGHSLGAGAAALLAMMLKSRGVQRLQCYAFACPPCMDQKLAADCKDYITSVALRDDVVARFSPQALARLNEELRNYDVEPAMQAEDLGAGLKTVVHIHHVVETIQNTKFPGFGNQVDEEGRSAEQKAKEGEHMREEVDEDEEKLVEYTPHIPGTVLYIYRTEDGGFGRALVDGTFEGLQTIHLSTAMITDHLANSYYEGLGQENLTHKTFIEEGKMPAPDGKDESGEKGQQIDGSGGDKDGDKGEDGDKEGQCGGEEGGDMEKGEGNDNGDG
ncbi:probable Sn1-specific diacylglycerol lipase alpha [Coccomyxa sp. Obi]|nr:probable Sn1-specific diacylglycerol lipase alpha [Coccomyxa sp. Obi]